MLVAAPLLLACQSPSTAPPGHHPAEPPSDPQRALVRGAMGLLGVRPSVEDLQRVGEDPDALQEILEGYLDDPRFGETIRDMHAEQFHLRWDVASHPTPMGPIAGATQIDLLRAIDETPLKLIEWVVTEGRPYSEIVTSDVVFANPLTAASYGLPYDSAGPEWQPSHYTDGRPAAGVLADNDVLFRYPSAGTNFSRSRAAFVAEATVCDSIGRRPLAVEVFDPRDADGVENPTCVACHADLDPIAAAYNDARDFLLSIQIREAYDEGCPPEQGACFPIQMWTPSGNQGLNPAPAAFYGTPVDGLGGLGEAIAADPRFASCAARRFYSWFSQTPTDQVPFEVWDPLTRDFVASGLDARELALAAVTDPSYDRVASVRPGQYARMVEDLTGYRWTGTPDGPLCAHQELGCIGEIDLARNDLYGNHSVMGGADGYLVFDSNPTPSPTRYLAQRWFAEEAATFVVGHDLGALPADRLLLTAADPSDTSTEAVRTQLRHLQMRILSEPDPNTARTEALFSNALARHGGIGQPLALASAWRLVIVALLLDDAAVMY